VRCLPGAALIALIVGVNNAPLVFANGASAARGIKPCIPTLRLRCSQSQIVLVEILPAFDSSKDVGIRPLDVHKSDTLP
jgi:hypothetical protein